MYEARHQHLLTRAQFARRVASHAVFALALLVVSLGIGILGYRHFENLPFVDAFLNAAMLLGGMGPVNPPQTVAGKTFAGLYALYSGIVFLVMATLVMAPFLHRLLHRFHWSDKL